MASSEEGPVRRKYGVVNQQYVKKEETFADLSDDLLLGILLEVEPAKLEELCDAIPRVKEVFEANEGSFPPPAHIGHGYLLQLEQLTEASDYALRGVIFTLNGVAVLLVKLNPSLEWIKRFMKYANSVTFAPRNVYPDIWRAGTDHYRRLENFIRNKCTIEKASVCLMDGPITDLVKMFPETTRVEVDVLNSRGALFDEITDEVLARACHIASAGLLIDNDIERVMRHRHLGFLLLTIVENVPLREVIAEWERGERVIDTWRLNVRETDLPLGFSEYIREEDGYYLHVEVTRPNELFMNISLFSQMW